MASNLTEQEKRSALEAVLASETLSRSEQLRAFLSFICEMEIAGRGGELNEYLIGVEALGRPASYSPLEDSSVRTRAYELRHRLQRFYEKEQPAAAVRIELPKGSYAPRFVPAPVSEAPVAEPAANGAKRTWAIPFLAGAAVATAICLAIWFRPAAHPGGALGDAWKPLAAKDQEILIALGTPLHLLVTPYMSAGPDDRPRYPAPKELYPLFSRYRNLPKDAVLEMEPVQKATPIGNVESAARVVAAFQRLNLPYRIVPETSSPLAAMRRRSAVLFGSPWYSRAAATLLEKTPWTTRWDEASRQIGLYRQKAGAEKMLLPQRGQRGEYQEVFGLISVLPNDTSQNGSRTIVVFSGLTSAGTHGAAAFFTSESDLADLARRFRAEGRNEWPKAFQVVVRCRSSEDAQLLQYSYETHEVVE